MSFEVVVNRRREEILKGQLLMALLCILFDKSIFKREGEEEDPKLIAFFLLGISREH